MQDIAADILSGLVDGVAVTDSHGTVLIWNRAAEEMTEIAVSDAVGKSIQEVFSGNPAVLSMI